MSYGMRYSEHFSTLQFFNHQNGTLTLKVAIILMLQWQLLSQELYTQNINRCSISGATMNDLCLWHGTK